MRTVNHCLIESALGYLAIAEAENGKPLPLDPDDEASMKAAFTKYVKPEVERWSSHRRERLKLSLVYFLDKPNVLEDDVLANIQDLTMREPSDIRQWFLWLYESLFPNENAKSVDVSDVVEDNDVMQMNFEPGELS
ncbi:MAG: hypothetical protein KatS3mg111_2093 [Pirellulaceae bacterium]|nr:MAG: hypothetical protein KatS3mg111_2093 [Pirellulaceae bacterium]